MIRIEYRKGEEVITDRPLATVESKIEFLVFLGEHRRRKGRRMLDRGNIGGGYRVLLMAEKAFTDAGELFMAGTELAPVRLSELADPDRVEALRVALDGIGDDTLAILIQTMNHIRQNRTPEKSLWDAIDGMAVDRGLISEEDE
jgi:hypothetical protein